MMASCSRLAGGRVVDASGDEIGRLDRILLDVPAGRVSAAVVAYGGVFGLGMKKAMVPWSALRVDPRTRCFVLAISRERLREGTRAALAFR